MASLDNNISSFGGFLDRDRGNLFNQNNELKYARNAIYKSETGDLGYIANEPSNFLCATIDYGDSKPVSIVGAIFLYDDYWAIFSTQNDQPTDGKPCEIGIFDYSRCVYIPVVRDSCLGFSPLFPVKGIRSFTPDNVSIVWADGYNFDKMMDLGPAIAWYKDPVSRGDVTTDPWLPEFRCIPYLFYDGNPNDDCVQIEYCQPLKLNCEALKLNPRLNPIIPIAKQSDKGGTLPNGLYYAAVAYSVNGKRYGNYYISPLAHVFTTNNTGSLSVTIQNIDNRIFNEFELVIISQVNNSLTAKILGYYSAETKNVDISFIEPTLPVADPTDIFRNVPIYDVSEGIFEISDMAVRVAPKPKYDFNYQPLANLIRVEWGAVEYPADYYHKTSKNTSTSIYDVAADAVSFMRDEVYTFYIRWVFDTGDRSPLFHIPAPPIKQMKVCEDTGDYLYTSISNSVSNGLNEKVQDGGSLIAYGYPGTFLSTEKYDCNNQFRWNYTWFKQNVLDVSKYCKNIELPLPYPGTKPEDYDLCCKNIRLVHFPAEDIFPNHLKLYNPVNNKIRYLGVRFSNIIHPFDNQGKPISNIVGYEILRASREGNKTIIAKGILEYTCAYDAKDELNQLNRNHFFANFPYDPLPITGLFYHPFLAKRRLNLRYSTLNGIPYVDTSPLCGNAVSKLFSYDSIFYNPALLYSLNFYDAFYPRLYAFRSPETNFGKPYANWSRVKLYGEYKGKMKPFYFTPDKFPRYKLLSPHAYWMINMRTLVNTLTTLNGTVQITFGNNAISANNLNISSDAFGVGSAVNITLLIAMLIGAFNQLNLLSLSFRIVSNPVVLYGLNTYGFTPLSIYTMYEEQQASLAFLTSVLGGGTFQPPKVQITPGVLDQFPPAARFLMYIPLFLSTFSSSLNDLENLFKLSVPFHDYALQIATYGFYNDFSNPRYGCNTTKIKDSVYIGRHIHNYYDKVINNLYRTPYVLIETYNKIHDKQILDHSLDIRVRCNCCDSKNPASGLPKEVQYDQLRRCSESFERDISARYVALKIENKRPYGQLYETKNIQMGFTIPVSFNDCDIKDQGCRCDPKTYEFKPAKCISRYTSPWMLYGDVYVTRYTEKDTFLFFYDFPAQDQPDGFDYDFLKRRNILYPRFWISTQTVDFLSSIYESDEFANKLCFTCSPNVQGGTLMQYPPCVGGKCPEAINDVMSTIFGLSINTSGGVGALAGVICGISNFFQNISNWISNFNMSLINSVVSLFNVSLSAASTDCDSIINCIKKIIGIIGLIFSVYIMVTVIVITFVTTIISLLISVVGNALVAITNLVNLFINLITAVTYDMNAGFLKNMLIPYNLDGCISSKCKDNNGRERFILYGMFGMWFYLAISSVRDFYVESEYNMAFRLSGNEMYEVPYSQFGHSNLYEHFRTKFIKSGDSFLYDNTLMASRQFLSFAGMGFMQPRDYNPLTIDFINKNNKFRLIYSLPERFNIYLPNNYRDFDDDITGLKNIYDSGAIVLFKHRSPLYFAGVDTLKTSLSVKVNIGDGIVFQQAQRNASNADPFYQFGSCQSAYAIVNSPYGVYYMSNSNGKIFLYSDGLQDISLSDMSRWFNYYLPYKINKYFPDFPIEDGIIDGTGSLVIYDGKYDLVYFCKRDYILRPDVAEKIENGQIKIKYFENYKPFSNQNLVYYRVFVVYDSSDNVIEFFSLGSDRMQYYFQDVSFTVSYSPLLKKFISFHDWHPDFGAGSNNGFFTVNENKIWKHNTSCDSFCNFYGVQYPFEVEFETDLGNNVTTIRSLEFNVEVRKYADDCNSYFHDLDAFFDRMVIYNSEQCSGYLDLVLKPKNNPILALQYPKATLLPSIQVLYEKVEQKYRVNQFWDIVKDRGEYSGAENIFIKYELDGYRRFLDNSALDYNKPVTQHKRIRHFSNLVWLIKNYQKNDNNKKIIVYLSNTKNQISNR